MRLGREPRTVSAAAAIKGAAAAVALLEDVGEATVAPRRKNVTRRGGAQSARRLGGRAVRAAEAIAGRIELEGGEASEESEPGGAAMGRTGPSPPTVRDLRGAREEGT